MAPAALTNTETKQDVPKRAPRRGGEDSASSSDAASVSCSSSDDAVTRLDQRIAEKRAAATYDSNSSTITAGMLLSTQRPGCVVPSTTTTITDQVVVSRLDQRIAEKQRAVGRPVRELDKRVGVVDDLDKTQNCRSSSNGHSLCGSSTSTTCPTCAWMEFPGAMDGKPRAANRGCRGGQDEQDHDDVVHNSNTIQCSSSSSERDGNKVGSGASSLLIGTTAHGRATLTAREDAITNKHGMNCRGTSRASSSRSTPMELRRFDDHIRAKTTQAPTDVAAERRDSGSSDLASRPDVEFGFGEDGEPPGRRGMAVAVAIEEDEDQFLPRAVQYDPDSKTAPIFYNPKLSLYAGVVAVIIVTIVISIGAAIGVALSKKDGPLPLSINRETLGIRENVQRLVGTDNVLLLEDESSPYYKALQWIMHNDARQMEPQHPQFAQRYLAAYFYYATSQSREWGGGCSKAKEGESDDCFYKTVYSVNPLDSEESPQKRWLGKSNECQWAGIGCDEEGQLKSIELTGDNMSGTFPEGVAAFPFLRSLILKFGELQGPLPEVVADMKHLLELDLSGNLFTGSIPESWYESRSLQLVTVSWNRVAGSISSSIDKLKDAKKVVFSGNRLSGQLPDEIGALNSATYVRLDNNRLNGTIPTTLGHLRDTASLHLHRNDITGTIPVEIGTMSALNDIQVNTNSLRGRIPKELYALSEMYRMDLFDNWLTGTISSSIGASTELVEFRVHSNRLSGTIPSEMGQLTKLEELTAYRNDFKGVVPYTICLLRHTFLLEGLETDCAAPVDGDAEIECDCCSVCCRPEGEFCYAQ